MAYKDYKGMLVADFPFSMLDIEKFAKAIGINIEGLSIIGFELDAGENHPDRPNNVPPEIEVYLLAVQENSWSDKYKNFGEYWNNEKVLKTVKFNTGINLSEFFSKYLKRFYGRMVWPKLQDHKLEIEFQEWQSEVP